MTGQIHVGRYNDENRIKYYPTWKRLPLRVIAAFLWKEVALPLFGFWMVRFLSLISHGLRLRTSPILMPPLAISSRIILLRIFIVRKIISSTISLSTIKINILSRTSSDHLPANQLALNIPGRKNLNCHRKNGRVSGSA